ncbi:MAG TPA: 16S rRNA (cytosine(967)-C(5))-methyltransferase RsmB [Nitrospiraceae bacterium]|nr:16S rRNA (cytosine(967)-C(5))-methyltransferase RsmB [Nitrospiraceae bacterium]
MKVKLNTRELALVALLEIWQRGKKPKDVLENLYPQIDKRERSFLMELVYGVLRHRDTLDWILKAFLKRPSGLWSQTINNLRLAVYQLFFMRVPEWAVVNEAVDLEKRRGRPELVNGVLRNMLRNRETIESRLNRLKEGKDPLHISLYTSHPQWLIKRWIRRFGEKEALELAGADNKIPPLTLRVNTLKAKRENIIQSFSDMGIHAEPTHFSPDGIKLRDFDAFKELSGTGLVIVQDEASQLITYLLEPRPGERILDACAAPGGKTTHIAQLMEDRGEIVAVDSEEERIQRLMTNISTLALASVNVVHTDIREYFVNEHFDRILLDAPCSSMGVIRRNPDIKYRYTAKDLSRFAAKQVGLLRSISRLLKPGCTMVYSVCSTEPEEGEEVIKEFLKDSKEFYIIDKAPVSFVKGFMNNGFFRTYPHKNDLDGFFAVRLCRRA